MKNYIFGLILFVSAFSQAQISLVTAAKSFPLGGYVSVLARKEFVLWEQKTPEKFWNYGFIKPQAEAASYGLLEGGIVIAPISLLEIGYFQSTTNRGYDSKEVSCRIGDCRGSIERRRFHLRATLGYKDFIFVPTYQKIRTEHEDKRSVISDEIENIYIARGGDDLEAITVLLGVKKEMEVMGLLLRQAKFDHSEQKNENQSLIYRNQFRNLFEYVGGIGRYDSSVADPGLNIFASLTYTLK